VFLGWPPQVLPDLKDHPLGALHSGAEHLQALLGSFSTDIDGFMLSLEAGPATSFSCNDIGTKRMANQHFGHALDHAMAASLGISLKEFKPEQRPLPLQRSEVRYFVILPAAEGHAGRRRSCIRDTLTGRRRFEVPEVRIDGVLHRPTLHSRADQGSVGWPFLSWLYQAQGIRGSLHHDDCHRQWNNSRNAIREAGLETALIEAIAAMSCHQGPWHGNAFFCIIRDAGRWYFQTRDVDCPIFLALYPELSKDLGADSGDMGSKEHMQFVFEKASRAHLLHNKGDNVKLGRWYSYVGKCKAFRPSRSSILLVLLSYGLRKGWWDHISDTPLYSSRHMQGDLADFGVGAEDLAAAAHVAEQLAVKKAGGGELVAPRSVKESNRLVERMRTGCKNTLHFTANVLANKWSCQMQDLLFTFLEPSSKAHSCHVSLSKTQAGCMQWRLMQAKGSWLDQLGGVWAKFEDMEALNYIGFKFESDLDEAEELHEQRLATVCFRLSLCICSHEFLTGAAYSFTLPCYFAALLDPDETARQGALALLKQWWETLCRLEATALDNPRCRKFVDSLVWPRDCFVRELLILLLEARFESIPEEAVRQPLLDYCRGLLGTKMVEDAFNVERNKECFSRRNLIGRLSRWHVLLARDTLGEYDRKALAITPAAKLAAATAEKVTAKICDGNQGVFSLGEEVLKELGQESTDWVSQAPQTAMLRPAAWLAALDAKGEWEPLEKAWLSLLLTKGALLYDATKKRASLVFKVTQYGVFTWQLTGFKAEGKFKYMRPVHATAAAKQPWLFISINSLVAWRAAASVCLPPSKAMKLLGRSAPGGLVLQMQGDPCSLPAWGAQHAFSSMTVHFLQKLMSHFKIPFGKGCRPTNEKGMLKALVKHVTGETPSETRLVELLAYRLKSAPDDACEGLVLDAENMSIVKEMVAPEDLPEVLNLEQEKAKAKEKQKKDSEPGSSSSSGNTAAGAPGRIKLARHKVSLTGSVTPDWAKSLTPQVAGCTLCEDSARHHRWACTYPKAPPCHVTKAWTNTGYTRVGALIHVLQTVWGWHEAATGESCPFQLEAAVLD
jgi:hypothetical protein